MNTTPKHFHYIFTLKYLGFTLLLCFIPILNAFLRFDVISVFSIFLQNFYILTFMGTIIFLMWKNSFFYFKNGDLVVRQGVFFKRNFTFKQDMITTIELIRSPIHQLFGATKVVIYFKSKLPIKKYTIYLPKNSASHISDTILPVRELPPVFSPTGTEKLIFIMLSVNIITSCGMTVYAGRKITNLFGNQFTQFAIDGFNDVSKYVSLIVPAGVSTLASLILIAIFISLLFSLSDSVGFKVGRGGGVIIIKGGLFTKIERRILLSTVSSCNLRLTPASRILRSRPLYISAGSFVSKHPILVCKLGNENYIQSLFPLFSIPKTKLAIFKNKSFPQYIWLSGSISCFLVALIFTAQNLSMTGVIPSLSLLLLCSLIWLTISIEGFFKEDFCKTPSRVFFLRFAKFGTIHEVWIFTHDISITVFQHSIAQRDGRCDFKIKTPSQSYKARGVSPYISRNIEFNM